LLEIRRDPFPQVERLAHVQGIACRVEHAIDAGQMRQTGEGFSRIEHVYSAAAYGRSSDRVRRASTRFAPVRCGISIAERYARMSSNTPVNMACVRRFVCVL